MELTEIGQRRFNESIFQLLGYGSITFNNLEDIELCRCNIRENGIIEDGLIIESGEINKIKLYDKYNNHLGNLTRDDISFGESDILKGNLIRIESFIISV